MKVEIVDTKRKQMTIQELAKEPFIGKLCSSGRRAFLTSCGPDFFFAYTDTLLSSRSKSAEECIRMGVGPDPYPEYYVFNTARELFKWIAE